MINPSQAVFYVVFGGVLIALGLMPGLFQAFADGLRSFRDSRFIPFQLANSRQEKIRQPKWLAGAGIALIAATLLIYMSIGL